MKTFKELNEKLGGREDSANWRQHSNGGGWVHVSAKVDDTAFIGENAIVWGRVYGDAQVSGDAWECSPLFIVGSRHSLTNAKQGHIQIGCRCETFLWWTSEVGINFAKQNGYTPEQIEEYRAYVALFKAVGK